MSATLVDADGDERAQFAAGEPAIVRLRIAAQAGVGAPRVTIELRDDGGLVLGGVACDTASLGWHTGAGEQEVRFQLDRLPLADGRFHLRGRAHRPRLRRAAAHARGRASASSSSRPAPRRGAVLLDGDWSLQETAADAPIGRP